MYGTNTYFIPKRALCWPPRDTLPGRLPIPQTSGSEPAPGQQLTSGELVKARTSLLCSARDLKEPPALTCAAGTDPHDTLSTRRRAGYHPESVRPTRTTAGSRAVPRFWCAKLSGELSLARQCKSDSSRLFRVAGL